MTTKRICIGTSGWHYAHWHGKYYPPDCPPAQWLAHYSRQFGCVEVNNSFYKLLEIDTIRSWVAETPEQFVFAIKASRLITHMKKLHNCAQSLKRFLERISAFGTKQGPILFQLPPHWHVNAKRLESFLEILPPGQCYTFEFRDPSWHTDEIYALLANYDAAFCQFDLNGFQSRETITADFVYVRLHGPAHAYAGSYSSRSLRSWSRKLKDWQSQGKDCYLFFDNDEQAYATQNAELMLDFCQARGRVDR